MQLGMRGGGWLDVHGGGLQDVMVQLGLWGWGASGERGVRRRQCGLVRRMLVLLHGGVRVHLLRRGRRELRGLVRGDMRGRGAVVLRGGVRRRER